MKEQEQRFSESELEETRRKIIAINTVITDEQFQKLKRAIGKRIVDQFVRVSFEYQILYNWEPKIDVGESSFTLENFSLIVDPSTNQKYLVFLAESTRRHFPRFETGLSRDTVLYQYTTQYVYEKATDQVLWSFDKPGSGYLYRGPEFKDSDFPSVLEVAVSYKDIKKRK